MKTDFDDTIYIWADGACSGNPGPGGWGVFLKWGTHEKEMYGGEANTTNNRMELLAVIKALDIIKTPKPIVIYTDSQYVCKGITEWIKGWIRKGWKTASNQPVKNADLWQELSDKTAQHNIRWEWVKGHAGDPGNERADALARKGCANA